MAVSRNAPTLFPAGDTRNLLIKWVVALVIPVVVFISFFGEAVVNTIVSPSTATLGVPTDPLSLTLVAIFTVIFYVTIIGLAGYLVATDTGKQGMLSVWLDMLAFMVVPIVLVYLQGLIIGLALSAIVWAIYFLVKNLFKRNKAVVAAVAPSAHRLDSDERDTVRHRAMIGAFWFAVVLSVAWLVLDLSYIINGQLSTILIIYVVVRTFVLPILGYGVGHLSGIVTLYLARPAKKKPTANGASQNGQKQKAAQASTTSVFSDLPLKSSGARRFFLTLVLAFILFYPILDPFLFGSGTDGRLAGYGDAGYYVILALGLNIVVGFAGLLDLGYVAFFAIGSYVWGIVGSNQLSVITGIPINVAILPWLFWPMLIVTALIAAFWGVLLGAPTLRLRGDYLAIVTLGFGEIVPIVFLELDKYTNGANGIVGVQPPAFPGVDWSSSTPYYYLILALIALVIFANVRLRDSRLGRAWVAIREDEIAAASSGINLVNTKLFAFAAGAFFSGIAGAYHAAKLGSVSPDNFSFGDSVIYLAMVVIGGIGSIPGVIVGALAVYAINEFILAQLDTLAADPTNFIHQISLAITSVIPGFTFGNIRNLTFGVILIVIMIFRPEGLIPNARRRRELHRTEADSFELEPLEVPPGAPDFESEVHVE